MDPHRDPIEGDWARTVLMLTLAGAGDEIQGLKRGLLEVADAVLVNKADGAGEAAALAHAQELSGALALLRRAGAPRTWTRRYGARVLRSRCDSRTWIDAGGPHDA